MRKLTFADFFAGIGGMRIGFESAGFEAVYANEIDPRCCEVYLANFKENPLGDIAKIDPSTIPDFDVFVGGFPCQPYSMAGKRNGFDDRRSEVISGIEKILMEKQPKAFLLENVKNLKHLRGGHIFIQIIKILEDCGYEVFDGVLNSKNFGVPQKRERLYIVGFRKDLGITNFSFPQGQGETTTVRDILEKSVSPEHYLSKKFLATLKRHKKRHAEKGNGFGYDVLKPEDIANTLVCGNMGRERNLVFDAISITSAENKFSKTRNGYNLRYLSAREFARIQGFPDSFSLHQYRTRAYKQIANSVAIPVIKNIANAIKNTIM